MIFLTYRWKADSNDIAPLNLSKRRILCAKLPSATIFMKSRFNQFLGCFLSGLTVSTSAGFGLVSYAAVISGRCTMLLRRGAIGRVAWRPLTTAAKETTCSFGWFCCSVSRENFLNRFWLKGWYLLPFQLSSVAVGIRDQPNQPYPVFTIRW